jgi:hypothetical protein
MKEVAYNYESGEFCISGLTYDELEALRVAIRQSRLPVKRTLTGVSDWIDIAENRCGKCNIPVEDFCKFHCRGKIIEKRALSGLQKLGCEKVGDIAKLGRIDVAKVVGTGATYIDIERGMVEMGLWKRINYGGTV